MSTAAPGHNRPQRAAAAATVSAAAARYLAAIYVLRSEHRPVIGAALARRLRVSAPSVTQALTRLEHAGYVVLRLLDAPKSGKEILLTVAGERAGAAACRRHRVVEYWLVERLHVDLAEAHEAAARLEGAFSPELVERLYAAAGCPARCPHGKPIPGTGAAAPAVPPPATSCVPATMSEAVVSPAPLAG